MVTVGFCKRDMSRKGAKNSIWAIDEKAKVVRPETSIAQSSLFTGAVHEPQMYTELKKGIVSRLWMKMTKNIFMVCEL